MGVNSPHPPRGEKEGRTRVSRTQLVTTNTSRCPAQPRRYLGVGQKVLRDREHHLVGQNVLKEERNVGGKDALKGPRVAHRKHPGKVVQDLLLLLLLRRRLRWGQGLRWERRFRETTRHNPNPLQTQQKKKKKKKKKKKPIDPAHLSHLG